MIATIQSAIVALMTAIVTLFAASAYDTWIDDPAVARAAREGLVKTVEVEAARAEADELRRQVEAGRKTITNFEDQLAIARRVAADEQEQTEREITAYEVRLEAAGRSCRLAPDDLEWLRKP